MAADMVKRRALNFLMVMTCCLVQLSLSLAAVHKVGDSAGWTILGNINYKQWASTKTFHLGDIISFEYNSQFHNVMRVTHEMYKSCNVSNPIETHTTGNDSITIKTKGHHFFVCGVPGHCQAGQKLDINVLRISSEIAPIPSSSSSPALASPSVPVAHTPPAPAPSQAAKLTASAAPFAFITGLLLAVFASFVPAFA